MVLHGRGSECAAIDALLDAGRRSASGSLVLRGEPGIGRSALIGYAADGATGFRVLRAGGAPSETGLPFAVLHQLLRPALDRLHALPEVQAAALAGALGLARNDAPDRFLIGLATLSLLAEHAGDGAVLVVVDDLQWADQESADALEFVRRRIDAEGICLLLATTQPAAAAGHDGSRERTVVGLDRVAGDALLIERARTTPPPEIRAFVWEQTHGNPSALIALTSLLTTPQLEGREPLPDEVRRGLALQHTRLARARGLPDDTLALLLVAAAEATGDIAVILRAAGELGVDAAALEAAEVSGIVRVDAGRLAFRDPAMRAALYEEAPFGRRQAVHRALAAAFGDAEPDRRAWHRADATVGPDEGVARELELAAERARARGGHPAASSALERAAALTSDARTAGARLAVSAEDALMAGRGQRAAALADRASELVDDPAARAALTFIRARVEAGAGNREVGFGLMLAAADETSGADPNAAARMLAEAGRLAWMEADPRMLADVGRRMDALALSDGGPERFTVDLMTGLFRLLEGDPAAAAPLIAASIERADGGDPAQLHLAAVAAMFTRDDRTAQTFLSRALSRARELGRVALLPRILVPAALTSTWEGAYAAARSLASEGDRLARDTRQDHLLAHFAGLLAWIAAVRGDDAACTELSGRALALAQEHRVRPSIAIATWARALSAIGAGRWADGTATLEAMVPRGAPDNHPMIALQAHADLVEAAQRAERPELAREIVDGYAPFEAGTAAPWARALLARGRGLVETGDAAVAAFEDALAHHAHSNRRFEEARTRLLLGEHLRRMKRRSEARLQLRAAIEIFERLGAVPWEERARAELRATGETARKRDPSTLDELTPQEVQIVRRVAEGATNKAVAAQLFISPRTVAYHLRNVFVKLGISSRAELARLVDLDDHRASPT